MLKIFSLLISGVTSITDRNLSFRNYAHGEADSRIDAHDGPILEDGGYNYRIAMAYGDCRMDEKWYTSIVNSFCTILSPAVGFNCATMWANSVTDAQCGFRPARIEGKS